MSNEELSSLIKRNPLKVVCVLLALVSGAGIYVLNTQIADATALLQQKTTEGTRLAANLKNAAQLPEQFEELTSVSEKIQNRLIRASQLATNLQYFYRLETEAGVELNPRQTSGSQPVAQNTGVGFSVSVIGDYPTLISCLQRLENGPHYCRILSASFGATSADRAGPLALNLSLELLGKP
jgi:hypothetical protein